MRALAVAAFVALAGAMPAQAVSYDIYAVCGLDPNGDNFLALREGPSTNHRLLARLPPGIELAEVRRVGDWMEVIVLPDWVREGYVFARYTCLVSDH